LRDDKTSKFFNSSNPTMHSTRINDADAWGKFLDDLQITMTQRLHAEVRRLQAAGIIDEHGNLLNDELPPDMREGSETTLGDW
jgi:hypothetical protein